MSRPHELVGMLFCALCGCSDGAIRAGSAACTKCRQRDAPTLAHMGFENFGMGAHELAEQAGVGRATVLRCLRGDPISKRSAEKLAPFLGVDAEHLRCGEPDPFRAEPELLVENPPEESAKPFALPVSQAARCRRPPSGGIEPRPTHRAQRGKGHA